MTHTSESFLRKSLAQVTFARKLVQVTSCASATWHAGMKVAG